MSLFLLAAAPVLLAAEAPSDAVAELRARIARAPRNVAAFIERRADCNHFMGEDGYDKERAAFLNRTIKELGCARLDHDERLLRHTYRNSPETLQLLEETADLLGV